MSSCVSVWQLLVREPLLAGDVSEYLAGSHFFLSEKLFFSHSLTFSPFSPSEKHFFFGLSITKVGRKSTKNV